MLTFKLKACNLQVYGYGLLADETYTLRAKEAFIFMGLSFWVRIMDPPSGSSET